MSRIPIEVLNNAFLYLNQVEKVECMLVCRQWAHTIKTLSLLETVRVSWDMDLWKIIDFLKTQPEEYRTTVKRLFLDMFFDDQHLATAVPSFFPNLNELYVFDYGNDFDVEDTPAIIGWSKDIKVLMEYYSSELTKTLLTHTMYSQLNVLFFNNRDSIGAEIVPSFANAPALTELYITNFRSEITDYELLHKHLPLLCKLTISGGDITSSTLPIEIQPPKNLKSLKITDIDIEREFQHRQFLQYIGRKYTNVTELILFINCKEIRSGAGYDLHKDDWKPVFAGIGPQLKSIGIEAYAIPDNFFAILDDAGCHIESMIIHGICITELSLPLVESSQSKYIKNLTVDNFRGTVTSFEYLKGLNKLSSLEVSYSQYSGEPFLWNQLLEECQDTLEKLSISHYDVKCHLKTDQIFSMKELEFNECELPKNFDKLLSKCMPNLKKLKFDKCKFKKRRLDLPNHDLDEFQLIACKPDNISIMLIETIKDKKKQWHFAQKGMQIFNSFIQVFDVHDAPAFPPVHIYPFDEMEFTHFVSLTCHSLNNLVLINGPSFD